MIGHKAEVHLDAKSVDQCFTSREGDRALMSRKRREDEWRFKKTKLGSLVFDDYILSTTRRGL